MHLQEVRLVHAANLDPTNCVYNFKRYGPACCNCDGKQSYHPASSSGWAPLFNPASASVAWQTLLKMLGSIPHTSGGVNRIVSPAMAMNAQVQPGVDCTADPAVGNNSHQCEGWMAGRNQFIVIQRESAREH